MKKFISIRWKFLAVCLIFVTLPTVTLGFLTYRTYYREALDNTRRDLTLIARDWQTTADVYSEEYRRVLKRERVLVEKRLESIALDVKKMIEFSDGSDAADIGTSHFQALLDKIAGIRIGRSGYVFIIDEKGNYVLSRDRKFDDMSVFGFPQSLPVEEYKAMFEEGRKLKGDTVKVLHYRWTEPGQPDPRMKVAVLSYVPSKGLLIGASMYYTDFQSYELERILAEELKDRMAAQKIGENGYVFAFDASTKFIVSKDRLRDGENLSDYRDARGTYFFRDLVSRAKGLGSGETLIISYRWKDLGEDRPQKRLAAVVYDPDWGWIIGAGAYEQDFLRGLASLRWSIIQLCLGFIGLGTLVALFFASHISRPIRQLEEIAARGDLGAPMDPRILSSGDEIGSLGQAFEGMMKTLREKIGEIERSRRELVAKNEELKLAQKQLVRSETLAAIGQLAAGVAHEINNPLAYVMSNMETLERYIEAYEGVVKDLEEFVRTQDDWSSPEDARADLKKHSGRMRDEKFVQVRSDIKNIITDLQGGLSRVKRIVMDLRTYARIEYEDQAEVHVEDVLEQVLTIVWGQIGHKANVVRDYGPTPAIKCQAQRLGQVFMNILVNAAHALKAEGGVIRIRTYAEGPWVCVGITDNGGGIIEEHLPRVFEPFFTTKPVGEGTGLGLSISYEIVKKHGGDIRVTSEPGQETTFTVSLPLGGHPPSEV